MDPDATLERWRIARRDGDKEEARDAREDLRDWIARGGFEPHWRSKAERVAILGTAGDDYATYANENPAETFWTPAMITIMGVGVLAAGAIGYFIWKNSQQGAQSPQTQTGPGQSTAPALPAPAQLPAASDTTDETIPGNYEAS